MKNIPGGGKEADSDSPECALCSVSHQPGSNFNEKKLSSFVITQHLPGSHKYFLVAEPPIRQLTRNNKDDKERHKTNCQHNHSTHTSELRGR